MKRERYEEAEAAYEQAKKLHFEASNLIVASYFESNNQEVIDRIKADAEIARLRFLVTSDKLIDEIYKKSEAQEAEYAAYLAEQGWFWGCIQWLCCKRKSN
jgi:hypothetical protein